MLTDYEIINQWDFAQQQTGIQRILDFARAIESAVRAEYADVPPATILTEHEMRDMLIACRSSVKFDMNQMELTALKPSLSAVSRDVADKEAQRLALLLGRIDALAGTE